MFPIKFSHVHSLTGKRTWRKRICPKKFAHEFSLKRKGVSRRNGYIFTEDDLKYIKEDYVKYQREPKLQDEEIWIFYKGILEDGKTRFYSPLGRFSWADREKLEKFVKLQEYTSTFGRKANHFHILGNHRALLKIRRILKIDKSTPHREFDIIIEDCVENLPVTLELVRQCIKAKTRPSNEIIAKWIFMNHQ